ncbi:MAG: ROK family protein [Clostridia bacterium]|nr:ROK family protein [Clostridia bacterium]
MVTFGALEAGGTKMVMGILDENGSILERVSIPTQEPDITVPAMIAFFSGKTIHALGIGCFGPLDLNPGSPQFGSITATPKIAWRHIPIRTLFMDALHIPVAIDTDVNAAALAESRLGAAKGLNSCLYVTIGTGIGGGVIIGGKPVHGLVHPEVGHQLVTPHPQDPCPEGFCPYHKHCLEGLAAGPTFEKRYAMSAKDLPHTHIAWDIEADYIAQMCHNAIMSFSPEKIILGGGVMQQQFLLPLVREKTLMLLGQYIQHPHMENGLKDYIVSPGLGIHSGLMGSFLLAKEAGNL